MTNPKSPSSGSSDDRTDESDARTDDERGSVDRRRGDSVDGADAPADSNAVPGDANEGDAIDERGSVDRRLPPGADPSLDWGLTSHLHPDGSPRIVERWLVVPPELAGLRLDHFVKTQITRLSRTRIQQVIETQMSRPDGSRAKSATTVAAGDRFLIRRVARPEPPCPRTFEIVHQDARMLVIDKPAGLPVHASAKFYFNTLTRVLGERFPDEPELQICHRLDRETSGCLVVARDREAAATLKLAFEHKRATKTYLAVVHGSPPWSDEETLEIPLRVATRTDPTRLPGVRMMTGPGGQRAVTRVRVIRQGAACAVVRCTLVTGRQHQIRAHLAATGFPIVGDKLYGHGDDAFVEFCDRGLTPELAAKFVLWRHALHAWTIRIPHPDGGDVTAEAPLPRELDALL